MAFDYTPDQQKVITNRGALLVSAAAGSGKTAVLVERILQCILDPVNPIDISQLLVVTFTNAAAAEMKERIGARLQELLAKDPSNPRLRKQQMVLAKANISTVDAFCKSLVTQHFQQLNCSPDFKILSTTALSVLSAEALEETLNSLLVTHPKEMKTLVDTLCPYQGTYALKTIITDIYEYLRSLPFPSLWVEQAKAHYNQFTAIEHSPWGTALLTRSLTLVNTSISTMAQGVKELACEPSAAKRHTLLQGALQGLYRVQTALENRDWNGVCQLVATLQKVGYTGDKTDPAIKPLTVQLQEVHNRVLETLWGYFEQEKETLEAQCRTLAPVISFLLDTVEVYHQLLAQKKKEQNAMDFADIEYAALSLLVTLEQGVPTPTPLAEEIASEFAFVMVDEFQDSNDLQTAIYNALSDGGKNLFTVGDVKQSIYRFRKANPNNFLRLLNTYPPYDGSCSPGTVILDGNFRSRGEICRTVNNFFSLTMTRQAGEITYDRSHYLIPKKEFPPAPAPVLLEVLEQDEERTLAQVEADRIAMHIKKAMETPCVTEGDTLRPARYEDCVILLRSHKNKAPLYVKRLQEHGIPAVSDSTDGFFEKREIGLITALLSCINNPTDDIAMASVMLSPFFGFTAEELSHIRTREKGVPLWVAINKTAGQGDPKACELVKQLESLRLYGVTCSPKELLQKIYHTYHALALVQLWDKGIARKQNLLALLSLAEEWEQNGGEGLSAFLAYLTKLSQEQDYTPQNGLNPGEGVRVMSVHRSKGLQFPLCFLAGCSGKKNNRDTAKSVVLDENLGLGVTVHHPQTRTHATTPAREAILLENKRAAVSEELRILYVAMTRAVDRLYLLATYENPLTAVEKAALELEGNLQNFVLAPSLVLSAPNFAKLFLYFALLHPSGNTLRAHANTSYGFLPAQETDLEVTLVKAKEIQAPQPLTPQTQKPLRATDSALLEQIRQNMTFQNPYAPLEQLLSKRSVSALTHNTGGIPPIPRPAFLQEQGLSPAEKGTALHEFMQYANYENAAANPQKEIARLVEKRFITPQQGEVIDCDKLSAFFQSPLYRRMTASPRVLREHRFMAALPANRTTPSLGEEWASQTVAVQGIVDCMFWEEDGFVVVDYKTDKVKTPHELILRYQKQLQLYAEMLKESEQKSVKELLIYSFSLNQTIRVPMDCNEQTDVI